ncbi:MAG: hypothetical protein QXI39_09550 [Candidatus Bathyarchaeia archaeon]
MNEAASIAFIRTQPSTLRLPPHGAGWGLEASKVMKPRRKPRT